MYIDIILVGIIIVIVILINTCKLMIIFVCEKIRTLKGSFLKFWNFIQNLISTQLW